jgi:uncharacterized protein (TIGR00730 family)
MSKISSVCLYCGSSSAVDKKYIEVARKTATLCVAAGWGIVYGGGHNGLMGAAADAALAAGGKVTGVIPAHLQELEVAHSSLTQLHVTQTMHERQLKMAELSDAFIIMPGGLGTLAEFFEIVTWKQLKLHNKPIAIINAFGFWDPQLEMIAQIEEQKFLYRAYSDLFIALPDAESVIAAWSVDKTAQK